MDAAYVRSALRSIALRGPMSMRRAPTRDRIAFGLLSPPRRSSRGRRSSKFSSKPGRGLAWDKNVFRSRLFQPAAIDPIPLSPSPLLRQPLPFRFYISAAIFLISRERLTKIGGKKVGG
jgi:hypothetical protein